MITAAAAAPFTICRRTSSRLVTAPRRRKFPVFSMAATSARLSLDRDSSSTMVGRLRTSVWIAKPKRSNWIAGTPIMRPRVSLSRRIWMNSFRSIGQKGDASTRCAGVMLPPPLHGPAVR